MAEFDFQKVWTLLDIILKIAQTGSNELHNIVTGAHEELRAVHDELGEELAGKAKIKAEEVARANADEAARAKAEAERNAPIDGLPRDGQGNIIPRQGVPVVGNQSNVALPPNPDVVPAPVPNPAPDPQPRAIPSSTFFNKDPSNGR